MAAPYGDIVTTQVDQNQVSYYNKFLAVKVYNNNVKYPIGDIIQYYSYVNPTDSEDLNRIGLDYLNTVGFQSFIKNEYNALKLLVATQGSTISSLQTQVTALQTRLNNLFAKNPLLVQ